MVRKSARTKKKRLEDAAYSGDDVSSLASNDSGARDDDWLMESDLTAVEDLAPKTAHMDMEDFQEHVDSIADSTKTVRIKAIQSVIKHLLFYSNLSFFQNCRGELISNLIACLRRPSKTEGVSGSHLIAIIGLLLGDEGLDFYFDAEAVLKPLVRNNAYVESRAAALKSLAVVCFACTHEDSDSLAVMNICADYFSTDVDSLMCSYALSSWGLLATLFSDETLAVTMTEKYLDVFVELLSHESLSVRSAAGENIALLYEAIHQHVEFFSGEEDARNILVSDRIFSLSKESNKKTKKKDRKEQRFIFRDIFKTVQDNESPMTSVTVKNELHEFEGWSHSKRFTAMKNVLQSGFLEHLQYNPTVRAFLELSTSVEIDVHDTHAERREIVSKNSDFSKKRCENLKLERRRRQNQKNSFLEEY